MNKTIKRIALIISILIVMSSMTIASVSAAEYGSADINIKVVQSSASVLKGDSITVDLVSDVDFTMGMFSSIDWNCTTSLGYELIDAVSEELRLDVNSKTKLLIISTDGEVQVEAGVPFASFSILANDSAILGKYTLAINQVNINDEDISQINATSQNIAFTVVDEIVNVPDPTTGPVSTVAPATSKPSTGIPAATPTATVNPAATPTATTDPLATSTPTPTVAPTSTPDINVVFNFDDVDASHWAYEHIMNLYNAGIVNGSSDTTFIPDNNVTRAEFVKMAVMMFGIELNSPDLNFDDVAPTEWYTPYIAAAVDEGMVNGVSDTMFAPNQTVTREEMATIIGRKLDLKSDVIPTFTDTDSIEDYAVPYVAALVEKEFLTGNNGMFRPKDTATRAEAATLLNKVYLAKDTLD